MAKTSIQVEHQCAENPPKKVPGAREEDVGIAKKISRGNLRASTAGATGLQKGGPGGGVAVRFKTFSQGIRE